MSVLQMRGLKKSYGKIQALDSLDLTIEKGEVYGLLGPNGSGKTTTLGIILNILHQDAGEYTWFDGQYGAKARRHIGAILETPNFYPYMNAIDNLDIIRRIKGVQSVDYDTLLERVNLAHRKKSHFRTYSLGMKQRLAIAATMIGDPQVLIFDEPTNGLDPEGIADIRVILKDIAEAGNTVIMASHILDEVEKICSHVAILRRGTLLASGPVGGILNNKSTLELDAPDQEKLISFLTDTSIFDAVVRSKSGWIECLIDEDTDISGISKMIYDHGITLTRLVSRKNRLEEEFLKITQKN